MKASNKKTIGTIKGKIGSVEIMTLGFFVVMLIVSVGQFVNEDFKEDWIYVIFFILTLTTLFRFTTHFHPKLKCGWKCPRGWLSIPRASGEISALAHNGLAITRMRFRNHCTVRR